MIYLDATFHHMVEYGCERLVGHSEGRSRGNGIVEGSERYNDEIHCSATGANEKDLADFGAPARSKDSKPALRLFRIHLVSKSLEITQGLGGLFAPVNLPTFGAFPGAGGGNRAFVANVL